MGDGASGGSWDNSGGGGGGSATNVELAGQEVMNDIAVALSRGITEFPELEAFANISEIREGDFSHDVLGSWNSNGEITIQRGLPAGGGIDSREWVAAHEVAHGFAENPPRGFRTPEQTILAATREFNSSQRRTGSRRLTQAGFARQISVYAKESPSEAIAEAFADWSINGNNANIASRTIINNWRQP